VSLRAPARAARCARAAVIGLSIGLLAIGMAPARAGSTTQETIDRLVRQGDDRPAEAIAQLDKLLPATAASTPAGQATTRAVALARAEVAARGLPAEQVGAWRDAAVAAAAAVHPLLALADANYLDALQAERLALPQAIDKAKAALAAYQKHCSAVAEAAPECHYASRWRMHTLLANAAGQGSPEDTRQQLAAALDLAQAGNDAWRLAWTEARMANIDGLVYRANEAERHLERARQHAQRHGDTLVMARVMMAEALFAMGRNDLPVARAALDRTLALTRQAHADRLAASVLTNLSDLAVRMKRPADALQAVEQGLPLARHLGERRLERALLNNALLARLALGQRAEARRDFEQLQTLWAAEGATAEQVGALVEFADALASSKDFAGALEMVHRERRLSQQLSAARREAAMAELRERYQQADQQRRIQLLTQDNLLKDTEVNNQRLTRGLWVLACAAIAITLLLVLLVWRRLRETSQLLQSSQARLKVQSERDPLTGLANRRHFQAAMQRDAASGGFTGALMMIDIDHFKSINDQHGHAAGDRVLVELARRVAGSVRGQDLVARWGGEEFLVLAPHLDACAVRALAQRLLLAVSGEPVMLAQGESLRVSASVGHAVFPLAPHQVPLSPEQAINLADMALYLAKSQGRNRAVGIEHADAADAEGLRALERDFERAATEGRVLLCVDLGVPAAIGAD